MVPLHFVAAPAPVLRVAAPAAFTCARAGADSGRALQSANGTPRRVDWPARRQSTPASAASPPGPLSASSSSSSSSLSSSRTKRNVSAEAEASASQRAERDQRSSPSTSTSAPPPCSLHPPSSSLLKRLVLITGFEQFNAQLYAEVAEHVRNALPSLDIVTFTDRDLADATARERVQHALVNADVVLASLLFDFDQVEWLRAHMTGVPVRLIFESSSELMELTRIGAFSMSSSSSSSSGMPKPIKSLLSKFGVGRREEDRLAGYLSLLKTGPRLLKYVPLAKAQDLRRWLEIYAYWNGGGRTNVASMILYIAKEVLAMPVVDRVPNVVDIPAIGLLHPQHHTYFRTPAEYERWHTERFPHMRTAPRVGLLLYRKHVISQLPYIGELITQLEHEGIVPVPVFINGVEAHIVVRDLFTTAHEQMQRHERGVKECPLREADAARVDVIVSTVGFPLVGGPAGSMAAGRQVDVARRLLTAKNVPYMVAAPLLVQDRRSWLSNGVQGLQSVVLYSLPELDGAVDTVVLGGLDGDRLVLEHDRVRCLAQRVHAWSSLARKPARERRVALTVYAFPPGAGATGTAALLNVPRSLVRILRALREAGYDVGDGGSGACSGDTGDTESEAATAGTTAALLADDSGEQLMRMVKAADEVVDGGLPPSPLSSSPPPGAPSASTATSTTATSKMSVRERLDRITTVSVDELASWLDAETRERVERNWNGSLARSGIKTLGDRLCLGGVWLGNVWIAVQPPVGLPGDPMRLLFERDATPHPQYIAFYEYIARNTDAVVSLGMHGTAEWLPGLPLGNDERSFPDKLFRTLPHMYVYAANNPSESSLAKRRAYGTIISHNVPPYGRAGLYGQLQTVRDVVRDAEEQRRLQQQQQQGQGSTSSTAVAPLDEAVLESLQNEVERAGLDTELPVEQLRREPDVYLQRLREYLAELETRLFSEGLHTLGKVPSDDDMQKYLGALDGDADKARDDADASGLSTDGHNHGAGDAAQSGAGGGDASSEHGTAGAAADSPSAQSHLHVAALLRRTDEEIANLVRGLNAEYIPAAPSGDLLRDGAGVLPTGRNIHALDPYRLPSPTAFERGRAIARATLQQHRDAHDGAYPESVAVMLWGLDAIKTRGESVGIVLELVGARVVREATGRVVRFELVPVAELGRPRVDALCSLSGIFRDSFANVVALLDDMFARAASAPDEPEAMNFVKRHAREDGGSTCRLYSNPPSEFGSLVADRVETSSWESGDELADTFVSRNAYSYGRDDNGAARAAEFGSMLARTDRIVQQIDSVEYGITDIQEYYGNTGALKRAAECSKRRRRGSAADGGSGGGDADNAGGVDASGTDTRVASNRASAGDEEEGVALSFVESFGSDTGRRPRDLNELLRVEYRSKLLNPRWADKMVAQGSGGAYEVSQRMTALLGWGGVTDFGDGFVFAQAADRYALDAQMAAALRRANPEAFRNVVGRLLEAAGRGIWRDADEERLQQLRALYDDVDAQIEGVGA